MSFSTICIVFLSAIGAMAGVQARTLVGRQNSDGSLIAPGNQMMLGAKLTQDGSVKSCFNQESLHYLYFDGDSGVTRASTSTLSGNSGALFTQLGSKLWVSFSNTTTSQRFDLSTCQQGAVGVLCDYPEGIRDPSLSVYSFAQGTSDWEFLADGSLVSAINREPGWRLCTQNCPRSTDPAKAFDSNSLQPGYDPNPYALDASANNGATIFVGADPPPPSDSSQVTWACQNIHIFQTPVPSTHNTRVRPQGQGEQDGQAPVAQQ